MVRDDFEARLVFLNARLREDEKAALALKPGKNTEVEGLRARALADVKMKRRLLEWVREPQEKVGDWGDTFWGDVAARAITQQWMRARQPVFEEIFQAYADHPDFAPGWKLAVVEEEPDTRARAHMV
ncbi:DUF6221 family protein [Streptomyces microflavus]|uniref:DUF6221 family protein n=2 Tax=Streptomyces microflavus TaxID=1919 RepID=A0ABV1QFL6_STRMI